MSIGEIKAFILCPFLPVIIFSACYFLYSLTGIENDNIKASLSLTAGLAIVGLFTSYVFTLLFAVPGYLIARKRDAVTHQAVYLCSAIIGAIIISVTGLLFGADEIVEFVPFVVVGSVLGLSAGIAFWFLLPNKAIKR